MFRAATTGRKSQALYSTPEEFTFELGEDGEMRNVNTPVKEEAPVPSSEDETPKESQVAMLGVPLPLRFYPLCGTCFASRHPKFRAPFTPCRNPSCPQLATTEWSIMHQKSCLSAWPITVAHLGGRQGPFGPAMTLHEQLHFRAVEIGVPTVYDIHVSSDL